MTAGLGNSIDRYVCFVHREGERISRTCCAPLTNTQPDAMTPVASSHAFAFSVSGAKRVATITTLSVSSISNVDTAFTSGVTATLIIE